MYVTHTLQYIVTQQVLSSKKHYYYYYESHIIPRAQMRNNCPLRFRSHIEIYCCNMQPLVWALSLIIGK